MALTKSQGTARYYGRPPSGDGRGNLAVRDGFLGRVAIGKPLWRGGVDRKRRATSRPQHRYERTKFDSRESAEGARGVLTERVPQMVLKRAVMRGDVMPAAPDTTSEDCLSESEFPRSRTAVRQPERTCHDRPQEHHRS